MWLGKFPVDLETSRLSVLGRTVKPVVCQYLWLPLQPCSAAFLHGHELESAEVWDREDY